MLRRLRPGKGWGRVDGDFVEKLQKYVSWNSGIAKFLLLHSTFTQLNQNTFNFSDGDVEEQPPKDDSDAEEQEVSKKASKKSKKNKNKKAEDSESDGDEAPAKKAPVKSKREAKKKAKEEDSDDGELLPSQPISAFALLQGDDDSDDVGTGIKSDNEDEPVKKPTKQKKKKKKDQDEGDDALAATGGKKEKKKKKKRGDSDDEDLDKMLADLQLEYAGEKKPEDAKADDSKKKDKKKGKEQPTVEPAAAPAVEPEPEASKKKDKKKKKTAGDDQVEPVTEPAPATEVTEPADDAESKPAEAEAAAAGPKKKKGPGKAMVAAMQEALKKKKEDEEKSARDEEERIKVLEEADRMKQEQIRQEHEKKELKKQKEKERKERLKAEGKLLTAKQKADKARAEAMIASLKASGAVVPVTGEKKVRPGTRIRPSKQKKEESAAEPSLPTKPDDEPEPTPQDAPAAVEKVEEEKPAPEEVAPEPVEEIKDAWDASEGEEEDDDDEEDKSTSQAEGKAAPEPAKKVDSKTKSTKRQESVEDESDSESESDDSESDDESEDDSSSEESDHRTDAEKMRERAELRIRKREQEAEKKRTLENLRAAVVCVLGHVDTGKTKILDKLRRTNVQDGEAGGITQQIGATNVPIDAIKDNTKHVNNYAEMIFKIPGLLIIDTPGHESFSNLRSRGSSLCDIAILVVDIMHGLEPQTIESLNLLKTRKTPFVVALNKIDRLYDWNTMPRKDVRDAIKSQGPNTNQEFDKRVNEIIVQFAEQGMNAALFYNNPDPRTYISMVPTSAITGEGMGNLLMLIVQFSQNQLAKRLMYSETLQATVLEVKAIPGLGTTIDAILINGKLREGDTMILAGTDGPIVTQIKALLMPQPMKELRVKNAYIEHKEILAAQGVKIASKELEKAIAGINLQIAQKPDEVEIYRWVRLTFESMKLTFFRPFQRHRGKRFEVSVAQHQVKRPWRVCPSINTWLTWSFAGVLENFEDSGELIFNDF